MSDVWKLCFVNLNSCVKNVRKTCPLGDLYEMSCSVEKTQYGDIVRRLFIGVGGEEGAYCRLSRCGRISSFSSKRKLWPIT